MSEHLPTGITGIYSWDYLYELGENQEKLWSQYLGKLAAVGASRE